jgi:hypothetical protein
MAVEVVEQVLLELLEHQAAMVVLEQHHLSQVLL